MLLPWEIKRKEMVPPRLMISMNVLGFFALLKVFLLNMRTMKSMKAMKPTSMYVRPTPQYTIPSLSPAMKRLDSDDKYLRPTLFCDCRAPEVVALAHELGAFRKSDREFAEAAFTFAKRQITLEIIPIDDVVPTLRRGTGTCIHKISVFIALCRAAGIKARYKFFALTMLDNWMGTAFERAPLMKKWYDAMGLFLLHGEGEVFLDGRWVAADVGAEPQRQAAAGLPITTLGEDSIGLWLFPIPGTMFWRESIPLGLGLPSRILMNHLVPNSVVGINASILEQIEKGSRIIAEAGGEEQYDADARTKRRSRTPVGDFVKPHEKISFED
jgi:hypothetical protein